MFIKRKRKLEDAALFLSYSYTLYKVRITMNEGEKDFLEVRKNLILQILQNLE